MCNTIPLRLALAGLLLLLLPPADAAAHGRGRPGRPPAGPPRTPPMTPYTPPATTQPPQTLPPMGVRRPQRPGGEGEDHVHAEEAAEAAGEAGPRSVADVQENWDELRDTDLGAEVMIEFLDNADQDRPAQDIMRDAIQTVLDRRDRAATAGQVDRATEAIFADQPAGGTTAPPGGEKPPAPTAEAAGGKPAGEVKLTPQEIQQLVEWGSRNQRPLEDIQEDADWANEARGGTGAVQLPPHRRAEGGAVFFPDPADAQEYDRAHSEIAVIDAQAQDRKDRAAALERRQRYWTAWEELADWRFAAGLMDLVTVDDNLAETRASIDRQIETLNEPPNNLVWVAHEGDVLAHREPGDTWRYGGREYPDYESAMAAYDQRHQRIAELEDDKQNLASYVDIMQRKTRDPDRPVGKHEREEYRRLESSMFNRPAEKLNEIGQEQDQLQGEIKDLQGRKRAASETMHRIEQQYGAR